MIDRTRALMIVESLLADIANRSGQPLRFSQALVDRWIELVIKGAQLELPTDTDTKH